MKMKQKQWKKEKNTKNKIY